MIVGRDFPSLFDQDNFKSRRTTGHNMRDPESLITGSEIAAGFSYSNSARNWSARADYIAACYGLLTTDQIIRRAPRVFISSAPEHSHDEPAYKEVQ